MRRRKREMLKLKRKGKVMMMPMHGVVSGRAICTVNGMSYSFMFRRFISSNNCTVTVKKIYVNFVSNKNDLWL